MAVPVQNVANVVSAYAKPQGVGAGMEARDKDQGSPFADLVKSAIKEAVKIGEKQEAISIAAINGRADMNQVVTAIAEAEATLQTVVAVRDKVLEAYKEVLRMPI
jgi:flagellar hook-basal body complex protein FliE